MRHTDEQMVEFERFRRLIYAANPRARVGPDSEGWPIAPGKHGQVEAMPGADWLAVHTTRRIVGALLAIPGVSRHQMGDGEARLRISVGDRECLRRALETIRVRIKRKGRAPSAAAMAALAKINAARA